MMYGLNSTASLTTKPSQNMCIVGAPFCIDSSSARCLENCVETVLKWLPRFVCPDKLYNCLNPYCMDFPLMLNISIYLRFNIIPTGEVIFVQKLTNHNQSFCNMKEVNQKLMDLC
jgi:hypothetical protein